MKYADRAAAELEAKDKEIRELNTHLGALKVRLKSPSLLKHCLLTKLFFTML